MVAASEQLNVRSVTGVELNLRIAGPGVRSYAFIIDWHVRIVLAMAWGFGAALLLPGSVGGWDDADTAHVLIAVLPSLALYFLYHPVLEMLTRGSTPGKRMAGVKIVTRSGDIPGLGALAIRNVFRLVDSLPAAYAIGLAATLLTRQQVRIGDLAAGTLLVYDEQPRGASLEQLERFGVAGLSVEQAELVHDLLGRWKELESPVRLELGKRLLARLEPTATASDEWAVHEALQGLLRR